MSCVGEVATAFQPAANMAARLAPHLELLRNLHTLYLAGHISRADALRLGVLLTAKPAVDGVQPTEPASQAQPAATSICNALLASPEQLREPTSPKPMQDAPQSRLLRGPHFSGQKRVGPHICGWENPETEKAVDALPPSECTHHEDLASPATLNSMARPRTPSLLADAQSHRKLVCCRSCESKRLVSHNQDIMTSVLDAMLAHGMLHKCCVPEMYLIADSLCDSLDLQLTSLRCRFCANSVRSVWRLVPWHAQAAAQGVLVSALQCNIQLCRQVYCTLTCAHPAAAIPLRRVRSELHTS